MQVARVGDVAVGSGVGVVVVVTKHQAGTSPRVETEVTGRVYPAHSSPGHHSPRVCHSGRNHLPDFSNPTLEAGGMSAARRSAAGRGHRQSEGTTVDRGPRAACGDDDSAGNLCRSPVPGCRGLAPGCMRMQLDCV